MFTGIIETIGSVRSVQRKNRSVTLTISAEELTEGLSVGDSVACDGICLTVTALGEQTFTADVVHETLRRSTFQDIRPGRAINLERSMPADGRFDGHLVTGHVDAVGTLDRVHRDGEAVWFDIRLDRDWMRYVAEKGSIAVDGISLTVATSKADGFSVSVIPHTYETTTLQYKRAGDALNIETDLVAKYVETLTNTRDGGLEEKLKRHGYK